MRFQSLVVIFIVLFALVAADEEFHPIDVSNPYMIDVGNFAVTEYNNKHNEQNSQIATTKLKFEKNINGENKFLKYGLGNYFRLTISAKNGSTSNNYKADVVDEPSRRFRSLISFELVA
ncbi:cysteine proteinase inhibitor [Trifolium repens]|nr:cysteine proteinase inhibitor [Trifolium repens]